jgi:hypothetical protein
MLVIVRRLAHNDVDISGTKLCEMIQDGEEQPHIRLVKHFKHFKNIPKTVVDTDPFVRTPTRKFAEVGPEHHLR